MTWFRAAALTLAAMYSAQLVPFAAGPLMECDHCIALYARCYVFVPGIIPTLQFDLEDKVFATVATLITLAMLASVTVAVRKLPPRAPVVVLAVTALLAGFNAYGFSQVLRM